MRTGRADPYGIAVNSGTSGLMLALLAMGIGPGHEVITPAFSFVASANCILHVGAKPVFVDCDPGTLNVRAEDVEKLITDRTREVIGVEVFGNPAGMDDLAKLCTKHEIPLLEDSCEGLGGRLRGEPVGKFGRMAVFAFYPNKQITTGEGGVIVTHDDRLADLCRSLRNQGRPINPSGGQPASSAVQVPGLGSWLDHERLGYNFRLSELNAAPRGGELQRLDEIIERRQQVASMYIRRLRGHSDIILPTIPAHVLMSWFVFVVRLTDRFSLDDRDGIIQGLRRHDIGTRTTSRPFRCNPSIEVDMASNPETFPPRNRSASGPSPCRSTTRSQNAKSTSSVKRST